MTGSVQQAMDRLGISVPPGAMETEEDTAFVTAIAADDKLNRDGKCHMLAAYCACRRDEQVGWDDLRAWSHASGWYDKAAAVLELIAP